MHHEEVQKNDLFGTSPPNIVVLFQLITVAVRRRADVTGHPKYKIWKRGLKAALANPLSKTFILKINNLVITLLCTPLSHVILLATLLRPSARVKPGALCYFVLRCSLFFFNS